MKIYKSLPLSFALSVGLSLTACNRADTASKPLASGDSPDTATPASYGDKTSTGNKTATNSPASSQLAIAATPESAADKNAMPDSSKRAADANAVAANSTWPVSPTASPAASPTNANQASADNHAALANTDRLAELKLTPDTIKSELAASGRVVRSRVTGANEPTGSMDSILVIQIEEKLQGDAGLSKLKIGVKADKGVVTLNGTAQSLDQIGQAIVLALDTGGVTQVVSLIKADATP